MEQNIFTIVLPVTPGKQGALRSLLEEFGYLGEAPVNDPLKLKSLSCLHYASLFLYDDDIDGWQLVFENNIDGSISDFIKALARVSDSKSALHRVFAHCQGFSSDNVVQYLEDRVNHPNAQFSGSVGRSREQIEFESQLHDFVSNILSELPTGTDTSSAAKSIRDALEKHDKLKEFKNIPKDMPDKEALTDAQSLAEVPEKTPNKLVDALSFIGLLSSAIFTSFRCGELKEGFQGVFALILFLLLGIWNLLRKEPSAKQDQYRPDLDHVKSQKAKEDFIGTNHMVSIVHLHQDFSRQYAKWSAFTLLNLIAKYKYVNGKLGSIPTIHFAHWVMLNRGRRLLFVSNFDGSWDSYLDDFTLKAASGLTLAWAHGVGFPKSIFMLLGGAARGPEFIDWARRSMVPNLVWYKAYPKLSIRNINRNSALRQAIAEDQGGTNKGNWLGLVQ